MPTAKKRTPASQVRVWWDDHSPRVNHRSAHWAMTARGWLFTDGNNGSVGNYLDYGYDHYRSPHDYCEAGKCKCRLSQPGSVHAVSYVARESRYFETVREAKAWIEMKAIACGAMSERESPAPSL